MLTGVVVRLSVEHDITSWRRATSHAGVGRAVREQTPDVVVADVTMGDGSVLDCLSELRELAPTSRVLLLSATDDPSAVSTALERGVAGFLSKETDSDLLAVHIRDMAAGKTVLDARSAAAVAAQLRDPATRRYALSARELEVLRLVAAGSRIPRSARNCSSPPARSRPTSIGFTPSSA